MALPVPLARSVSVTRALALRRVRLVSRPETLSFAPGATAVRGGELIDRSFADGVAAWDAAAGRATSAHADKPASDLASRIDNVSSPSVLRSRAAGAHCRQAGVEGNLLTVGRSVKSTTKERRRCSKTN